jgi:beta-galactosidase
MDFDRKDGFLCRYEVNGKALLNEGGKLTPNFWRAPTDNDMGAKLQQKLAIWKNPGLKLTKLSATTENGLVRLNAEYELKPVSATLSLQYIINNEGAIQVTQKLSATPSAQIPELFRFGMQMQLPYESEHILYYGRGPVENYADRNQSTDLGIYSQTADEQFHPYVRPQETGTKTDIRWWTLTDVSNRGLKFVGEAPFSASALHYSIESLDDGWEKEQRNSAWLEKDGYTNFCIDKVQMGVGCVNSWGALPMEKYRLPYGDYEFSFAIYPAGFR